ncbi:MAG: TIGR01212 family radical SAM protein [Clostridia bacterium]|nr:TIGR01212 family radical SAM protein [Clostridia bacterium]MBR2412960.1 TIGR01212 family radical SAM protein [Clostridia bacterium]
MITYTSLNDYCLSNFGKKLYKLTVDGGFTCPNRDGTCGTKGCVFCSADGSGAFAEKGKNITQQLENAISRIASKKPQGYIAYFQAFTNTYAPVDVLRERFLCAIRFPDVQVLDIATRPDCLGEDVLDLLEELNKIKPVWVELGLQTSKEESVTYIRRGYENEVYLQAVQNLKKRGIYCVTHLILGLPHETEEDMKNSLQFALDAGTDAVKLQLLHILKDTDLANDFLAGKFEALTMEEYIRLLTVLLPMIPKEVSVHRMTGDGDKKQLIAPMWSADKKRVLNAIRKALEEK